MRARSCDPGVDLGPIESVESGLQTEELPAGLLRVERCVLEGGADAQAHLPWLGHDVVPGHRGLTFGEGEQGAEQAHSGGLAGAIGAKEPVDLA